MTRFLVSFLFLFLSLQSIYPQKFLQLEKAGTLKVKKFFVGDEIYFQVKEGQETYWRTEVITDILVDERILLFPKGMVRLEDITAIKTFRNAQSARRFSLMFYNFGIGWLVFSLADALVGGTLSWSVAVVTGSSLAIGFIIGKIFKAKTYRLGNKRRLRVLDVTFRNGP